MHVNASDGQDLDDHVEEVAVRLVTVMQEEAQLGQHKKHVLRGIELLELLARHLLEALLRRGIVGSGSSPILVTLEALRSEHLLELAALILPEG